MTRTPNCFAFWVSSLGFAPTSDRINDIMRIAGRYFCCFLLIGVLLTVQSSEAAEKSAKSIPVRIGYVSRSILDIP